MRRVWSSAIECSSTRSAIELRSGAARRNRFGEDCKRASCAGSCVLRAARCALPVACDMLRAAGYALCGCVLCTRTRLASSYSQIVECETLQKFRFQKKCKSVLLKSSGLVRMRRK